MKKITVEKLLKNLFDIKNGKKRRIKLFSKDKKNKAILGSEGENVFSMFNNALCSFDDCLFYMTQNKVWYIKK